jgi:hypothetical protein
MKKVLMGTTALVAAGAAVAGGVAQAQEEPIEIGIGGYYRAAMGFVDQDTDAGEIGFDQHSHSIGQDIELTFSGSTTLDNGLTAGVSMQLEGNGASTSQSSSLDERFLFFRGSFGQIRVGATESARQEMVNFAPSGAYNFGVNTPFFKFWSPNGFGGFGAGGTDDLISTYNDDLGVEDSIKILYFSPVFNGFRVGVSYAPDDTDFGQYGGSSKNDQGGLQNQLGLGAEYSNDFGDFSVRVSGGYETYVLEACSTTAAIVTLGTSTATSIVTTPVANNNCEDSPNSWNAGATVSFGGFSIGGGYHEHDAVANDPGVGGSLIGGENVYSSFDVGIAWWGGPWGVGIQYGYAESEQVGSIVAGSLVDNTTEIQQFAINGTYIIGPGIDLQAQVDFGEVSDDLLAGDSDKQDNDWVSLLIGTSITF